MLRIRTVFTLAALCAGSLIAQSALAQGQGGQGGDNQGGDGNQGGGNVGGNVDTGGTVSGGVSGSANEQFNQQTQDGLRQNLGAADAIFENNRQTGEFVGGDAATQADTFARANADQAGGLVGLDNFFRALSGMNANAGQVQNQRRRIRAPLRIGFAVSKPDPVEIASAFEERLTQLPVYQDHANVVANLDDRTLTLTGTVQTQEERIMVERLALLEPGVYRVNNQLTVVAADQ